MACFCSNDKLESEISKETALHEKSLFVNNLKPKELLVLRGYFAPAMTLKIKKNVFTNFFFYQLFGTIANLSVKVSNEIEFAHWYGNKHGHQNRLKIGKELRQFPIQTAQVLRACG